MKRAPLLGMLLVMAACMLSISPAQARWSGWKPYENHYLGVYAKCYKTLGSQCGRNIVDDGLASGATPSRTRVEASSARMTSWLSPAPSVASADSVGIAQTAPVATNVSSATTTGSCAPSGAATSSIVQAESGGNPTAVNSSSGAYGCYQILPSTWASSCSDLGAETGSSTSAQAACAARLPSSAWAATGG